MLDKRFPLPKARGFELSYLGKLSQVRDTHTRQPLLHHVCVLLLQLYPQSSDLYSDITAVTKAGKVRTVGNNYNPPPKRLILKQSHIWCSKVSLISAV